MLFAVSMTRVRVVGRADVFHAVDATAFGAAFDGAVARHLFLGVRVSEQVRVGGGREE